MQFISQDISCWSIHGFIFWHFEIDIPEYPENTFSLAQLLAENEYLRRCLEIQNTSPWNPAEAWSAWTARLGRHAVCHPGSIACPSHVASAYTLESFAGALDLLPEEAPAVTEEGALLPIVLQENTMLSLSAVPLGPGQVGSSWFYHQAARVALMAACRKEKCSKCTGAPKLMLLGPVSDASLFLCQESRLCTRSSPWEEVPGTLAQPYISVKISMNKLTFLKISAP